MHTIHDQSATVQNAILIFGNTLRVGIIRQLYLGKTSRREIAKALSVTEDSLTRQIALLVDHGLVAAEIIRGEVGRPVKYTLDKEATRALFSALEDYFRGASLPSPTSEAAGLEGNGVERDL